VGPNSLLGLPKESGRDHSFSIGEIRPFTDHEKALSQSREGRESSSLHYGRKTVSPLRKTNNVIP